MASAAAANTAATTTRSSTASTCLATKPRAPRPRTQGLGKNSAESPCVLAAFAETRSPTPGHVPPFLCVWGPSFLAVAITPIQRLVDNITSRRTIQPPHRTFSKPPPYYSAVKTAALFELFFARDICLERLQWPSYIFSERRIIPGSSGVMLASKTPILSPLNSPFCPLGSGYSRAQRTKRAVERTQPG
jgi:hypothetical protein